MWCAGVGPFYIQGLRTVDTVFTLHINHYSILYFHLGQSHIQGDSGGICITLGSDSMSDSKQISSYEHGSDFERLRSYGHFLIPVHAFM